MTGRSQMPDIPIQAQWLTAQQAVLGSVLIDAKCADAVLAETRPGDYTGVYREIYLVVQSLVHGGQAPDPVSVLHRMSGDGTAARRLLAELIEITPTSTNCRTYMEILVEQSKLHQVRQTALALAECGSLDEAEGVAAKLEELMADRTGRAVYGMPELLDRFMDRHSESDPVKYLTWGMKRLDTRLYAETGDFVVLGGYPSSGKTALALSFAWHQSEDRRVGFFSLETREDKLFDRQVAMITGIPMGRIKRNQMSDADWQTFVGHGSEISHHTLDIIPAAGMSATEVMQFAKARGYQVIYIDYIQLLRADNPRAPRYEQVSQSSMTLHTLANQYGITVVGLSQLRRPDRTRNTAPTMSDLRESGQLEQDADVILLLYQAFPDNPSAPERDLKIAKNKEGEASKVLQLHFEGSTQRFAPAKDRRPMKERVEEAREEQAYEVAQMSLIEGQDDEMPF